MRIRGEQSRRYVQRSIAQTLGLISLVLCVVSSPAAFAANGTVTNLALAAMGGHAHSWEPGVPVIPEHEPAKANDGSVWSYWEARPENLPSDLGIEWQQPQTLSSVVVRYLDGRMVRGPWVARTQQWARLQYWDNGEWRSISADVFGQETSVVRYRFAPVTTTRIRLLFTEPPDPQDHANTSPVGIYVAEFEAFKDAPFQAVTCPECLQHVNRPEPHFNEEPASDSPYDQAGPLIVEPEQTRIFTDTLTPTLIVRESRWARQPVTASHDANHSILRNGFLALELSTQGDLKETHLSNLVTGEAVDMPRSQAFLLRTATGLVPSGDFKVQRVVTSSTADAAHVRVDLTSLEFAVTMHYDLRKADHFYHKWLSVTNNSRSAAQILDVTVSSLHLPRLTDLMAGAELTYPIAHLSRGGFFEALETVYWDHDGDALTYYPGTTVAPNSSFDSEKAAIGVYQKLGEVIGGWDRGVREWVVEYHAQVSPLPAAWPDIYCEGWSAKVGVKEMQDRPQWTDQFLETLHQLGVRYMDTWEPTQNALAMSPALVQRWVDLAAKHQIGTGWWNDFGSDNPWDWGKPMKPVACKLSPEAEAYYESIVNLVRTHRLLCLHWADFFAVWPCNKPAHGHLPGKYSIYAQGQRMVRFAKEMHEASPGVMLGADGGLTNPQYGRFADDRHHGGGVDAQPAAEPDIHLDRLYGEMNREYLYVAHMTFLRPWFRLLNCVNHFGQESHSHDSAGYRYSLLSALGLAGQLTFDDAPANMGRDIGFTQHWEAWARANKDYLQEGDRLFDRSLHYDAILQGRPDSLAGFSHIRGDRGYVFLANPTPVAQIAELKLALDSPAGQVFGVEEIFPGGMRLSGPANGRYPEGGVLRVTVPGRQVRVLWIAPSSTFNAQLTPTPEDSRAAANDRYIAQWTAERGPSQTAILRSHFGYPANAGALLSSDEPQSAIKEPWAFNRPYLVLTLKYEHAAIQDHWVPDGIALGVAKDAAGTPMTVRVNGVDRRVYAFKTERNQDKDVSRCFFVFLGNEAKPGAVNDVEVTMPIRSGYTFAGAYVDLPDQMPYGELPQNPATVSASTQLTESRSNVAAQK